MSEKGILNRQIRSIQTEGDLGNIKGIEDFRRLNHPSKDKVYKEFLLYAIGHSINKYHCFLNGSLKKFEEKQCKRQHKKNTFKENADHGFLRQKTETETI